MTQVEFLNAIVNSEINADVIAYAEDRLAKHEADLLKAKAKRAEKAKTTDANIDIAFGFLTSAPQTCSDLVSAFVANGMVRADEKPITPQYVARLMKSLVDAGRAARVEVKLEGKKGKSVAYIVVEADAEADAE